MATRAETAHFLLDQMAGAGRVSAKKMFGEYGVYCGGKFVALICDDQLFVKPTVEGRALLGTPRDGIPYPGAKPHFLIDGDLCEDADWLADLIRTTARALPPPKSKTRPAAAKAKSKAKAKAAAKVKARRARRSAKR